MLLTTEDVARELQVTAATVRAWIRAGDLAAIALSNKAGYRVLRSDLDAFLNARRGTLAGTAA